MAVTVLQLQARVSADTKDAEAALAKLKKQADETSGKSGSGGLKGVLEHALGIATGVGAVAALGAGLGLLVGQVGEVISATNEQDQATAQLNSVLQSTGDASHMTMGQLVGLADSLSTYTDYSKPALEQSEKVLLTFTDIGSNVFPGAEKATADLAARMGIDLQSAALIVGKALGDPIKGVTALRREGVQLSAAQDEQVKHFMKVGDVADAQKIILGELNREMGGAAKAAGSTLGGQLDILHHKLEDTEATIGQKLEPVLAKLLARVVPLATAIGQALVGAIQTVLPIVVTLSNKVLDFVTFLQTHEGAMTAFKVALAAIGAVIAVVLVAAFVSWATAAGAAAVATVVATAPVLLIMAAIGLLVAGIILLVTHWKQVTDFLGNVWKAVMTATQNQLAVVGVAFSALGTLVHNIGAGIGAAIKGAINLVIGDINGFIRFLDAIQIHIPSVGVGPVKTPAFDWNGLGLGQIPYLAEGGDITRGGIAMVGERGPEPVYLPTAAQVRPAGSMGPQTIIVQLVADGRKLAEVTVPHIHTIIRNASGRREF